MKTVLKCFATSLCIVVASTIYADSLISNDFSKESGWSPFLSNAATAAGGSVLFGDGKAVAKCPALDSLGPYEVQILKPIDLDASRTYIIKFKATSDKAGDFRITYGLSREPYTSYASASVSLEEGDRDYECKIAVMPDKDGHFEDPRQLRFILGSLKATTISISDISLDETN